MRQSTLKRVSLKCFQTQENACEQVAMASSGFTYNWLKIGASVFLTNQSIVCGFQLSVLSFESTSRLL